jgi:RIO kinase 1
LHQSQNSWDVLDTAAGADDSTIGVPELDPFVDRGFITSVYAPLTSGKEGSVYCCRAHPAAHRRFVAAKVYREHAEGSYKWDATYFQGRERVLKPQVMRAVRARSAFGKQVAASLWLEAEYANLRTCHRGGVSVPEPIALADRALLMEYIGNGATPAPLLHGVELEPQEARRLYERIVREIALMLRIHLVHADLSPYNILYWHGDVYIIDLPQAVDPRFNHAALDLLRRDIENVSAWFSRFAVPVEPATLAATLWERYQRAAL